MSIFIYFFGLLAGFLATLINVVIVLKMNQKRKAIRDDLEYFSENVSPCILGSFSEQALKSIKNMSMKSKIIVTLIGSIIPWVGFFELIAMVIFVLFVIPKRIKHLNDLKDDVKIQKIKALHRISCFSMQLLIGQIELNINKLKSENFHVKIAEQAYDTLMELIEHSFVHEMLSKQSLQRILRSGNELKELTQKLLEKAQEEKSKNIDLNFDKFDQVIQSICRDIDEVGMIFE